MSVFECKVMGTYKRSLDRQVAEGTQLERAEVDQWTSCSTAVRSITAVRCPG